jgi:hypothetical protein
LYEIGRFPQVIRCAPKLGFEGCWLGPKVLSACHDGAGLQNVFTHLVAESTFTDSCLVDSQVSSGAGGVNVVFKFD